MKYLTLLLLLVLGALAPACQQPAATAYEPAADRIGWVVDELNELMMHDVTSPPLAARFFAYALLAGHEALAPHDPACPALAGRLRRPLALARPAATGYSPRLGALLAMLQTAGKLQPSGKALEARQQTLLAECRQRGMPAEMVAASQQYAQAVATAVLAYAKQDGYYRLSDRPRYTPSAGAGYWYPTPPAFLPPVEPYFGTLRPFVLDSAAPLGPRPPQAFDPRPGSGFYGLMQQVRQAGDSLTGEQRQIAGFWDCNPFAVRDVGHLQVGLKKMSPGAHWMKIAGLACRQSQVPFGRALHLHTVLALTLTDAFICCWQEKYRSNRIRPETAIRRYLAPQWQPLLQTPPFPEYVSGHSVISTAAAEVLGQYFGPAYAYTDNTEKEFGLRPRHFTSFRQAAEEAAISRLYGGIHFLDAIEQGQALGQAVGETAVRRLCVPRPGAPIAAQASR
ncbi:vanadium-dependent haloperoxidase [Hymenobacter nivis]|uniref:Phosphatase PAP2 family protein n=1 Tax=Hymenobacter nivis TaxID=1850093 RepID=A0A502GWC3_9BACT|nr:vanadium-dependent haloperoxidase [Hymenobacter nivis]TPG66569.1 phosphatase PAP2 family protein [Hymenobacter nivis]